MRGAANPDVSRTYGGSWEARFCSDQQTVAEVAGVPLVRRGFGSAGSGMGAIRTAG